MIPGLNKRAFNFYDVMLYVALVHKHLRLMVLLVCMSLLAGLAVYVYSRPVYFARSMVRVDELALPVDSDSVFHDSNFAALITQLKSPALMERVARRLGIDAGYREIDSKYLRQLRITPTQDAGGLEVDVYSYVESWPSRWTEIMVDEFLKMRDENHRKYRDAITKSWGAVVGEAGDKLHENWDNHFRIEDQSKLIDASIDMNRLRDVPVTLAKVKQRIDTLNDVIRKLDDPTLTVVARLSLIDSVTGDAQLRVGQVVGQSGTSALDQTQSIAPTLVSDSNGTESVVIPGVASTPEWQSYDLEQRRLQQEIADASRIYLPGNRKMIALSKQMDDVQRNLQLAYLTARNRLTLERQSLIDQEEDLSKKLPAYQEINRKYAQLQQDSQLHDAGQVAYENIAVNAEKYINQLDYTSGKERVSLQYAGILEASSRPVSPNMFHLALFSLFGGIVLAFAMPFLIEYLDFTLSNLEEVEQIFQMRGLGIVPQLANADNRSMLMGVHEEIKECNLMENFRVVRTNLLAMGTLTKAPHVTMVTSAMPKEGKTIISANLALSFHQMSKKTLLMDTDLRRGRLHRLFGMRKSPGLSDVLVGKISLDEALRPAANGLCILSSGEHLESGTELLTSPKFTELMRELRGRFEHIVVDTPPVLGLSETSILQRHMDGVLFVIWSGRTPIRNMKTAVDILQTNGANFYGFILNRLDLTTTANYYQYYYYSSDYYHSYHAIENA